MNIETLLLASFGLAFLFGWLANQSHFCTLGAISDYVYMEDSTRLRQWGIAATIGIIGTQILAVQHWVPIEQSFYLQPKLYWLAHLVGGSCFGVGMVLASGCSNKTLVRIGQGNLKALVVLIVMGLTAWMTLKGLFSIPRVNWLQAPVLFFEKKASLFSLFPFVSDITQFWLTIGFCSGLLFFFSWQKTTFISWRVFLTALGIGSLIPLGWLITGHFAYLENPDTLEMGFLITNSHTPESFSFVAPSAYLLELLTLWTDQSLHLSFGIISLIGVILGALFYSLFTKQFALESFADSTDLMKHLGGAVLMGFGGVTGLGCTIGQGMSGLSTLAMGSFLTLGSILISSFLMLKYQYYRIMQEN